MLKISNYLFLLRYNYFNENNAAPRVGGAGLLRCSHSYEHSAINKNILKAINHREKGWLGAVEGSDQFGRKVHKSSRANQINPSRLGIYLIIFYLLPIPNVQGKSIKWWIIVG